MAHLVIILTLCFAAATATLGSQYRSDYMLSETLYPEDFSHPTGGGRVHYTIPSLVSYSKAAMPYTVQIDIAGSTETIKMAADGSLPS